MPTYEQLRLLEDRGRRHRWSYAAHNGAWRRTCRYCGAVQDKATKKYSHWRTVQRPHDATYYHKTYCVPPDQHLPVETARGS